MNESLEEFNAQWEELPNIFYRLLMRDENLGLYSDLENMPKEMVLSHLVSLFQEAKKLDSRSNIKKSVDRSLLKLKTGFKKTALPIVRWFSDHGKAEHEFLRSIIPDDFVSRQVAWSFVLDQSLTIAYSSLFGGRADLTKLGNPSLEYTLAANPHGNLFTFYSNPPHLFDLAYNGVNTLSGESANLSLLFARGNTHEDSIYAPYSTHNGKLSSRNERGEIQEREATLWQSLVLGIKSLHPSESNLGGVYVKELVSRVACFHFYFILSFFFYYTLGHLSALEAIKAFLYTFTAATWAYNWPWKAAAVATQGTDRSIQNFSKSFTSAKEKLDLGIQLQNQEMISGAYNELFTLMQKDKTFVNQFLNQLLEKQNYDAGQNSGQINQYIQALQQLILAMNTRDPRRIDEASLKLHSFYENPINVSTAEDLLNFAIQNPPSATKANPIFQKVLIIGASILTTALSISLVDQSFRTNELTPSFLSMTAVKHASLYAFFYLLLGKKSFETYTKPLTRVMNHASKSYGALGCQAMLIR
jgi:hypothetical protein